MTNYFKLLLLFIGVYLAASGAGVLNNYLERDLDARMTRTGFRPLPARRVSSRVSLFFGILISVLGTIILSIFLNILTGLLTILTLFIYLGVYTPLKRKSPVALYIGSVAGALPPVIGISAVMGRITIEALSLFLILFFWQIPHFLSLSWIYRDDYRRAGYKVSSVVDPEGRSTVLQIVVSSVLLIPVSLLPVFFNNAGLFYAVGSLALSIYFLLRCIIFWKTVTNMDARKIFILSLWYIPVLFMLMIVERFISDQ